MSEIKELLPEEIKELKDYSGSYTKLINTLGELDLQIHELENKIEELKTERSYSYNDYESLKGKNEELTNKLINKYGEGKINLDTGKIELF
jgi:uncharacterized protein YdcH (DUF465 family)